MSQDFASQIDQRVDFTGKDALGKTVSLDDYRGKTLVLVFFPRANTSGCTLELTTLNNDYQSFLDLDADIVACSADNVAAQVKFCEKNNFKFKVLSDPDLVICKAFHAYGTKKIFGKESLGVTRKTVVIDPQGVIRKEFNKVTTRTHSQTLLEYLDPDGRVVKHSASMEDEEDDEANVVTRRSTRRNSAANSPAPAVATPASPAAKPAARAKKPAAAPAVKKPQPKQQESEDDGEEEQEEEEEQQQQDEEEQQQDEEEQEQEEQQQDNEEEVVEEQNEPQQQQQQLDIAPVPAAPVPAVPVPAAPVPAAPVPAAPVEQAVDQ